MYAWQDNLPTNWTFMEFRIPVVKNAGAAEATWVQARAERHCADGKVTKTVTIGSNPFTTLRVRPWAEDAKVLGFTPAAGAMPNATAGHVGWELKGESARIVLALDAGSSGCK
jgi:hypothetical protein